MKNNQLLTLALVIIAAFLLFFEPQLGWRIRNGLAGRFSGNAADESSLVLRNEKLQAEVARLTSIKNQLPNQPYGYLRAEVFSRYPLNFKNELLINIGKDEGIVPGAAVTFGGILVGKIKSVYADTSVAQTVFDGGFQAAVRVGPSGFESLLRGGTLPMLTLIPLKANVAQGYIVYSASPDLPYGLPIGEVDKISVSSDKLFREATVKFSYDISAIQTVMVKK